MKKDGDINPVQTNKGPKNHGDLHRAEEGCQWWFYCNAQVELTCGAAWSQSSRLWDNTGSALGLSNVAGDDGSHYPVKNAITAVKGQLSL